MAEDTHGMGIPVPADSTRIQDFPKVARAGFERVAEVMAGGMTEGMAEVGAEVVAAEIVRRDLVTGGDPRMPSRDDAAGISFTVTDARGRQLWLQANDTDGGPTPLALDLLGPALQDHLGLLTGDDPRIPDTEALPGKSLVMTDARGRQLWLQANDTDGGPTPLAVELMRKHLGTPAEQARAYITAGDSITQGGHGGGANWQQVVSDLLGGIPVINSGVSGCTALEIAIKQGSLTPVITITAGALPAGTTAVDVTLDNLPTESNWWSASGQPARAYTGTFEGIPAVLTKSKENTWSLKRTTAGAELPAVPRTPFLVKGLDPAATWILWPGRNDYPKANLRGAVDRMTRWITDAGGRFLILSTLTRSGAPSTDSDSREVAEQNRITQEQHPRDFVNVRDFLVRHGLQAAGLTPTQADTDAMAVGGIPPSLMADGLHPNAAGRLAIGKYVHKQLLIRDLA